MVTESTISGIFRETPMAMNLVGLRLMLISSAKVANDIMIMVMLLMLSEPVKNYLADFVR